MHFLPTDTTHLTFSNQLTLLRFVREKAQSQQRPVAWVTTPSVNGSTITVQRLTTCLVMLLSG